MAGEDIGGVGGMASGSDRQNPGGGNSTRYEKQRGVIYDLIAAGEIEGVVGGLAGIFFNDTALTDVPSMTHTAVSTGNAPRKGKVTVSSSSTTISSATDDSGNGLFAGMVTGDLTDSPRYIQIDGAGASSTLSIATTPMITQIVVSDSNTFTAAMATAVGKTGIPGIHDTIKYMIRIPGAAADGGTYQGTITAVGDGPTGTNNKAWVQPPIRKVVASGTAVYVDEVRQITAITDENTATLSSAPTRSATATTALMGPAWRPVYSANATGASNLNFASAKATVYNGTRTQYAHPVSTGAAAAAYTAGINQALLWHDKANGSATGASTTYINANSFNYSQNSKEEVDQVKLSIEFPGGLNNTTDEGRDRVAYCELQIVLEYKVDANGSYISKLIYGKDYGGSNFDNAVTAWSTTYDTQKQQFGGGRGGNGVISRKNQKVKFMQDFTVDLKPYQPLADWRIGVKRFSPVDSIDYTVEQHHFSGPANLKFAQAIIEEKLNYPLSAYSVVEFTAEDFPQPPKRSYHVRGRKIKVPSNYLTREEVGSNQAKYTRNKTTGVDTNSYVSWDGTFRGDLLDSTPTKNLKKVYCNNPAWIFYDMLIDKDIGLGNFISEDEIDKYALYQIARYCDELVPDGKGGQEPRFTCNVYIKKQTEAYKVLKDLASAFRGMMYWIDGLITPVQDSFKEPIYTFTNGNVKEGKFDYTYTGQRARTNQVNATWTDPSENFKQSIVTIDDPANIIEQNRIISKDVVAFGCTSEAQAKRLASWHLITDVKETEVVSFTTGINGAYLRPGDFINIQDHYLNGINAGGRVRSSATTTHSYNGGTLNTHAITLDREVLGSGSGYSVSSPGNPAVDPTSENFSHILYLIYPEPGVYLAQASATIGSTDYVRNNLILSDSNGNPITTETAAANLVDDSGNAVLTQWAPNTRIEKHYIVSKSTTDGITTVKTYQSFTELPNTEVIWAIGPTEEYATTDIKTYRVLSIQEEDTEIYAITGAVVSIDKFDEIEKDRSVQLPEYSPFSLASQAVPPPENISLELVPTAGASIDGSETTIEAIISWTAPESSQTDTSGTANTQEYQYTSRYEIQHNLKDGDLPGNLSSLVVAGSANSIRIPNVSAGTYQIKIRTISDMGGRSVWQVATRTVTAPPPNLNRVTRVARGGILTAGLDFDTYENKVVIDKDDFTYISPANYLYAVTSGTTAQKVQSFNSMSNNTTAYLYYDFSDTTDPWKALQVHTDTTVVDSGGGVINFNYFKEVGATNNGLAAATGTVTTTIGSTKVTGSGTAFLTDFAEGDLIKIQTGTAPGTETAGAEYQEIAEVQSDTVLYTKRSYQKAFTAKYPIKQSFKPDFANDAILAVVQRGANASSYAFEAYVNQKGKRLAGQWYVPVASTPTTASQAQTAWDADWDGRPGKAVTADQAIFYEGDSTDMTAQSAWTYDGSAWQSQATIIDGDLIVTGSISTDKIAANAITTDLLAANSITANEIAANSITANEIAANAITANEIAANAITATEIAANAITANEIAANSVTANAVTATSVVATLISANSVKAADISTTNLAAISANLGDITAGSLKGGTVPDANAGPSGTETGSFFDLDDGKFVVGNASKYILFDGTNLNLSGVVIESSTLSGTGAEITVKEDGTSEATDITTLDFTTGINVVAANAVATVSVDLAGLSTTNLSEGTNLYYTDARARAAVSATTGSAAYNSTTGVFTIPSTTTHITEGDNLYYTNARADARIALADIKSLANVKDWDDNNLAAGQLLIYDATETEFANATLTAGNNVTITNGDGAITIAATDTDTTYSAGTGLSLSGTTFSLNAVINDLGDVTIGTSASGQTLIWNNDTGNFVNATLSAGDNTTITSADGSITIASSDTTYTAGTGLTLSSEEFSLNASLTTLNDVTIANPAAGQLLIYDATAAVFENAALSAGNNVTITNGDGAITIAATDTDTTYSAGTGLSLSDTTFSLNASLTTLNDVTITSPAAGHVLIYDATATVFENATLTAGNNVTITNGDGAITIAATDTDTTYSAGTGLSLSNTTFSLASTISGNRTFSNDVTISGNLTVNGTTTTLNVNTVTIEDNVIVVNSAQTGTPATTVTAGLEVERGDEANKTFLWAETGLGANSDEAGWTFGSDKVKAGTFYGNFVGDITGSPTTLTGLDTDDLAEGSTNLYFTDERAQDAVGTILAGSGATSVSYDDANGSITISSTDTNTFRTVSVDTTGDGTVNNTLEAGETLVFKKGNNITLAEAGGVITISSTDTNTTYTAATTAADGLMSAADKTKLDGVDTGANAYSLPIASASTLGGIKVGSNLSISSGVLSATDTNTTYSASTGLSLVDTTFSHADTSSQASVNNSNGNVIQDVTLDGFGHVTALGSVDLDTRYYTESEMNQSIARIMGWEPAYNNSNESTVIWNITQDAVELLDPTGDTTVGMAYRAIYLEAGEKIRFTVTLKASAASTTGLYMRIYTYNGNLPDGKTHVSNDTAASSAFVQEDSSGIVNFVENGAMPTGWTTYEYTYTQGTTGYASLVILNWSGFTGSLYVKQPHFDKLPVVSLTGSGATSISGSYPSFTISSTDTNTVYTHPNHSGDVTSSGDGATTIANDAVTNAKLANMAVSTIKGRVTAGTGDPEDLTATQVRALINVENGATADQTQADINALAITQVGTISSGTWQGTKVASAYLDNDTAHLSGTQTFSGAKTFSSTVDIAKLEIDGKTVLDMPSNSTERGPWNPIATAIRSSGKCLYLDEDFASGNNGVTVYNNSGGGTVTHTRELASTTLGTTAPNDSQYVIKIYYNGGTASPGFGGFYQTIPSEDNHTFVQVFQALLPADKNLVINENAQGSNNTSYWLTDTAGTGKWEWYVRVSHCGDSGTFSSGGHVSVTGGSGAFTWYLASCTAIDVTEKPLNIAVTATAAELNVLDGITATTTELNYTDGVTSNIQTQLNGKQASGSYLTGNQTITLSGDATGSGTTSIAVSLAANSVGASELNVTGNGTSGQALLSDGDGTFSWGSAGTTYSAGNGIGLSGTEFSVAAGSGLTQDADGLSLSNNATGSWFVDNLTANTIDADYITANTIDATQLKISANSDSTASSMFFDGTNNNIKIYDASAVLRVKIGNLS